MNYLTIQKVLSKIKLKSKKIKIFETSYIKVQV